MIAQGHQRPTKERWRTDSKVGTSWFGEENNGGNAETECTIDSTQMMFMIMRELVDDESDDDPVWRGDDDMLTTERELYH